MAYKRIVKKKKSKSNKHNDDDNESEEVDNVDESPKYLDVPANDSLFEKLTFDARMYISSRTNSFPTALATRDAAKAIKKVTKIKGVRNWSLLLSLLLLAASY